MTRTYTACLHIDIEVVRMNQHRAAEQVFTHLSSHLEAEILDAMGFKPGELDGPEVDMLLASAELRDLVVNGRQVWALVEGKKVKLSWVFSMLSLQSEGFDVAVVGRGPPSLIAPARLEMQAYVFDSIEELRLFLQSSENYVYNPNSPTLIYPACPRTDIEFTTGSPAGQIDLVRLLTEDIITLLNPPRK